MFRLDFLQHKYCCANFNDKFSFPGDLALDLNRMPRGSKSVKTCNLDMAKKDGSVPHVSLFKLKHMRGWWPFTVNTDLEEIELAVSIIYF